MVRCLPIWRIMADRLGILLISGGHERAHYAFMLASAAAAIGRSVVVFATNEGCRALLADLSGFAAAEASLLARGLASLAELREACVELGVTLMACEAGMRVAGLEGGLCGGATVSGLVTFLTQTGSGQIITL